MKKPTSVYIDSTLVMAMNSKGIEISPFINRCMALFLGVPEDPDDDLIKRKSEVVVSTLLLSYQKELNEKVKEQAEKSKIDAARQEQEEKLITFGNNLKKLSDYQKFERCLNAKDIEDDFLQAVTVKVNKMQKTDLERNDLWNRAITWFQKYGKVQ